MLKEKELREHAEFPNALQVSQISESQARFFGNLQGFSESRAWFA